ncbi:protein WFDC10B [Pipistrellus kuhlii]|uniref:WAP four-disulfide core domain 10B n=1 Tax=Pipistrellus kuhlii TaxID=59472 RepID=A0A7J7YBD6_PIPKU|nr:protein WFDC10B [Pipistrellus kuhlii]KAF6359297.1 WAP four-disulfide core domain 10B [Pipistrellus kuhlii]
MPTQALLPILLLCVQLLQAQGGHLRRNKMNSAAKACQKQPSVQHCSNHCSYFLKCPNSDTICCSTFCGNVCMDLL